MKMWWIVFAMVFAVAACGSGNDREVAIESLQEELGFSQSQAVCAVDALEGEFGSLGFVNNPDDLDQEQTLRAGELLLDCMGELPGASSEPVADTPADTGETSESAAPSGEVTRDEAIAELVAQSGITQDEGVCVIDAVEDEFGDLSLIENPDDVTDAEFEQLAGLLLECAPSLLGNSDTGATAADAVAAAPTATPAAEPTSAPVSAAAVGVADLNADQLCELIDGDDIATVFNLSGPSYVDEAYESTPFSVCTWGDPDSEELVQRGVVVIRDDDATSLVQLDQAIDIPGAEAADYRPEFLDGRDFLEVHANGQTATFEWRSGTPGALDLIVPAATRWAALKNGEEPPASTAVVAPPEDDDDSTGAEAASADGLNPNSPDPGGIQALGFYWTGCGLGDPDSCDYLYLNAPEDTLYYEFGNSCGGREAVNCHELLGDDQGSLKPNFAAPGSDAALDAMWVACGGGDADKCDELYFAAPSRSKHEWFGFTCGGRGAFNDCQQAIDQYEG